MKSDRSNYLRAACVCNLLSKRIKDMIDRWAKKWGVQKEAIAHLRQILGAIDTDPTCDHGHTDETDVQNETRLRASQRGDRLWRNNSGAFRDDTGRYVRFGLCNDSPELNKKIKSSDLIGIHPRVVTSDMVGSTIGQFLAVECKKPGWKYQGKEREAAQLKYLELVISLGGIAYFERGDTL